MAIAQGQDFGKMVCEALGLDVDVTRRIIIDINSGAHGLVMVYVERYGTDGLFNVDWAAGLTGAEITKIEEIG